MSKPLGHLKMLVICSDSSVDIFERIHYLKSSKCGSLVVWCFVFFCYTVIQVNVLHV